MLKIDKANKTLVALAAKTMKESGYWERRDIQDMICRSPQEFCDELGERIWLVGSEVAPSDFVQDRIDLLGVDADSSAVVIEIKRDSHKLHLLQALSYAGMVAKWEPKHFVEELHKFNQKWGATTGDTAHTIEDATEELEQELDEGDIESINRNQRVVLLAEAFDYEVLVTAEWLTERYEVDIRCYRIALANNGGDEFLTCTRAYPPPELTDIAIRRRKKRETGTAPALDWREALKTIENPAAVKFFQEELSNGRSSNVKYRALRFTVGGRRRFVVYAKRRWARVWQNGRFDGDFEFWRARLSRNEDTLALGSGRSLRLYLQTEADFAKFKKAVEGELTSTEFHGAPEVDSDDPDEGKS